MNMYIYIYTYTYIYLFLTACLESMINWPKWGIRGGDDETGRLQIWKKTEAVVSGSCLLPSSNLRLKAATLSEK